MKYYLAIDIGASSGRHIIGYYKNNTLNTIEVYRFKNEMKEIDNHLTWDINYLFQEVKNGIKECFKIYKNIESLSIDTWGVDYVLMNNDKEILPVYAYRDDRTKESILNVHKLIPFDELYALTGTQFQPFNTIYQLYDDKVHNRLNNATDFLMIPEYLIYKLTGIKVKEYTNASTTGLMDLKTNTFSKYIINKLELNVNLFNNELSKNGIIGYLKEDIQKEVNGNLKVKLCSTHDTASAVEGIKMEENSPYISSGTWSLLGIKVEKGINTTQAMLANYSNEYGPNYIRFQKNIMGLWIIQNLAKEYKLNFEEIVNLAKTSNYDEIYNVNDEKFLNTPNMNNEIISWFTNQNKNIPQNKSDILNSTFHSLAHSYKIALDELEEITNQKYNNLYVVGGGAKNQYLNDLIQKYTNKNVIALPIEATAIGNLLSQMEDQYE